MKNIFITGASGFIGKNLLEALDDKYKIYAPSHKELELLDSQAVDEFFLKNKIDIVVHLANRGGSQKEATIENPLSINLRMFFNLVRNQTYFKKMIFVGSGAEYGKQYPIVKVKENDFGKRVPEDDFGFYKYIAAKYIEKSENIVNLRVFGIYGKYEDWRYRFISNTICKVLFDMPIIIHKNVYFDYLYINDFVRILEYFINTKPRYKTYNVGSGQRIDLVTIAKIINNVLKKDLPIKVIEKGLNNEYTCNNRLVKELPRFKFTEIRKAVDELSLWYKENLGSIDKKSLNLKRVEIWKNER